MIEKKLNVTKQVWEIMRRTQVWYVTIPYFI